jgi:hypothetical protein
MTKSPAEFRTSECPHEFRRKLYFHWISSLTQFRWKPPSSFHSTNDVCKFVSHEAVYRRLRFGELSRFWWSFYGAAPLQQLIICRRYTGAYLTTFCTPMLFSHSHSSFNSVLSNSIERGSNLVRELHNNTKLFESWKPNFTYKLWSKLDR